MYKGYKFAAVVPARGGSKGIPRKNIFPVNGKPLIYYTLDGAFESKYLDKVFVSTEDEEIAEVASDYGASIIHRPLQLARDESRTIDVLIHCVRSFDEEYDFLVLLQPTQPMRKSFHIDEAIEMMIDKECSSLVSVSPAKKHPIFLREVRDNKLFPVMNCSSTVRRQDLNNIYAVNGAIYINKIIELNETVSLNDNDFGYVMDSKYDIDIDEPFDIFMFENIIKWLGSGGE